MSAQPGAAESVNAARLSGGTVRWLVTLTIVAVDAVWLTLTHHSIANAGSWVLLPAIMLMFIFFAIAVGMALLMSINRFQPYRKAAEKEVYRRSLITANYLLLMFVFIQAVVILNYLAIALDVPVIDTRLAEADSLLGFDWPQVFNWVQSHALIKSVLHGVYGTLGLQALIIPVFLGMTGRDRYLNELSSNLIVSFLLMLLSASPFPAHCAFTSYGLGSADDLSMVSHFDALRDGTLKIFDIGNLQGLVCFPSMHTAMAILLAYSLRSFTRLFPVAAVLNLVMIISTPTEGGHYLVDTLAGLVLGGLTIVITHASTNQKRIDS